MSRFAEVSSTSHRRDVSIRNAGQQMAGPSRCFGYGIGVLVPFHAEVVDGLVGGLQHRNTLDDALRMVPGVHSVNGGGQRNERMVNVCGFDRWRGPLSIDGMRICLPA